MPTKTRIIYVRHGETDQNVGMQNGERMKEIDYPLNANGIEQVRATRDLLAAEPIQVIVSSPLRRAQHTAEIINEQHGAPILFETDLSERRAGGVDLENWNKLFDIDENVTPEGDNTEAVADFFKRVYAVIDRLVEQHEGKTIAVVAHGGVQHAFYAYFNKLPWKGNMRIDRIHNAEVRYYEMDSKEESDEI